MPVGRNVQDHRRENISLGKAGWRHHLKTVRILLKTLFVINYCVWLHGSWGYALDPGACWQIALQRLGRWWRCLWGAGQRQGLSHCIWGSGFCRGPTGSVGEKLCQWKLWNNANYTVTYMADLWGWTNFNAHHQIIFIVISKSIQFLKIRNTENQKVPHLKRKLYPYNLCY